MKLALIVPVLNQHDLAQTAIDFALENLSGNNLVQIIVLDNGSDVPFLYHGVNLEIHPKVTVDVIRLEKNIGVYPTFWEALKHTDADVLAFIHSDLIIEEKGWDTNVLKYFDEIEPRMGLMGFIGSNEIDWHGGRGAGTTSNFLGLETETHTKTGEVKKWKGSPAEAHGRRSTVYSLASVVDGCVMIFRRSVLEQIKQRPEFPPHHFYDRLLSCETRELGYEVGVLGIGCDHISGQTVNQENAYHIMAKEWLDNHPTAHRDLPSDSEIYLEAERQWLSEYRDNKHLVPTRV